jgi:hypothetical protein
LFPAKYEFGLFCFATSIDRLSELAHCVRDELRLSLVQDRRSG